MFHKFINTFTKRNTIQAIMGSLNRDNIKSAMLLSAFGDACGYKNGLWEFEKSPSRIYREYEKLGGYENLKINEKDWRLSDDTIMHIATALAITRPTNTDNQSICKELATAYIRSMEDMGGRAPGAQTINSVSMMAPCVGFKVYKWNEIPFSDRAGGCGGSMRSMCIGLKYWSDEQLDTLIELSIESGRITHNNPVGFLGAFVSALFASYAIRSIPPKTWGLKLMTEAMPKVREYLEKTSNDTNRNMNDYEKGWNYFWNSFKTYLKSRQIPSTPEELKNATEKNIDYPVFPTDYSDYNVREHFYQSISFSGWGGSSGHDSCIIAYDALLGAGDNWEEMIKRSVLHGGDNDSTGAIGCCWWGALYGFKGVPECNYETIEYKTIIEVLSNEILKSTK
ncbi:hypothetical protein RB653_009046 [Dictyostelium firmibasis]|uniref:ADP-ribosylhydrolase ARH1 n=1 Tax=Dictyostelium firmibasis TaxID=79012 RepID=A0AAN7YPT1_9MYCE